MNNKSLNILLVQPSVEDFYFTPHRSSSLGLHTLAAFWNARGHKCRILNCTMEKPLKKKIKLPESLTYLEPYLLKQNKDMKGSSWFSQYYSFGPSDEKCVEKVMDYKPDVVAVSCFAWSYSDNSRRLLEKLRDIRNTSTSSFLLVAGGPGVTVMPEYFTPCADLVVSGEGEEAISLIEKLYNNIVNKKDYPLEGKIIDLEYSEELSFVYNIRNRRDSRFTVSTIISRGCPKKCSFCANHLVFGRSLRNVPLANLKNGMDSIINDISTKKNPYQEKFKIHINFEDDNILFYREYFLEILNYINLICHKNKIDFSFSAENGMDYILLNNELLEKFHSLNLSQLNISMASMDNEELKAAKRYGNLTKLESILDKSAELNIPAVTYFICGLSGDTAKKTVETINYLHSLKTSIGISHFYPVPGLPDWQNKNVFIEKPQAICRGSSAYSWNNSLSTKELITAFRLARASNYIKSLKINNQETEKLKLNMLEDQTLENDMVKSFFISLVPADQKTMKT